MPRDVVAALEEQFRSPCTTEMASFDRFVDFMEGGEWDLVVFDTAPTGHTLRLLELPVDYSQQVELMVATTKESAVLRTETRSRFERIIARLRGRERTVFAFVVYPESTPVVEAHRASLDLGAAGITTQLVIANQVIPPEQATNGFFQRRRAMQLRHLEDIGRRFGVPVLEIPLLDEEPRGIGRLAQLGEAVLGQQAVEALREVTP